MEKVQVNDVFKKLLQDENFKKKYFLFFLDRFVYQTADVEGDLDVEKRKKLISNLLEAFNYIIDNNSPRLSPYDIIDVANIINRDSGIEGIRKTHVSPGEFATWEVANAADILPSLYNLSNNYMRVWDLRDPYEREAVFHIELMRIHPFEDGNKRTAKLFTNAHLIKQNFPPIIMSENETKEYYEYINKYDVDGLTNFIKNKSKEELSSAISLYKMLHDVPSTDSYVDGMGNDGKQR